MKLLKAILVGYGIAAYAGLIAFLANYFPKIAAIIFLLGVGTVLSIVFYSEQ